MEEIKLDLKNRVEVLQRALEVLQKGGTVVYPTETSYGLGCDFYNDKAMRKIYRIKNRSKKFPLSVIIPDIVAASYLVEFNQKARYLAFENWPGPLTLILPYKYCKYQKECDDFLALRVSSHPLAADLASNFGKPIVATSANISGQPDAYNPQTIRKYFQNAKYQPDLFINAGVLPKRQTSTIVKFDAEAKSSIIRQGDIKIAKKYL